MRARVPAINIRLPVLILALLCLGVSGCSKQTPAPEPASTDTSAKAVSAQAIQWLDGDMANALALASEQGKPVFAYWGAEWCPYCNQLQATVFRREEFIALSHQFVAVDMSNGNSADIRAADEYKIRGVPTVIILSQEGEEITRIAGGYDPEQYAAVLEMTLNTIRPVAELLASVQAGESLSADDWYLLSSYSWHDRGNLLDQDKAPDVLQGLYEACPAQQAVVCSKLGVAAMGTWLRADQEGRADRAAQYTAMVEAILDSPDLAQANLTALVNLGDRIVKTAAPDQQEALQARLLSLGKAEIEDPDTYLLRKAGLLGGWVDIATMQLEEGESLPAEQMAWVRDQADAALAALDSYQVQSGVNSLWGVYYDVGLTDRARETLQYGVENAQAPYYFMSGMAYLEQKEGNMDAALDWRRQAWENTRQPVHQISWGRGYLLRLLEQTPENTAEIQRVGSAVIGEILDFNDGVEIYAKSLDRLNTALEEWSSEDAQRIAVLSALRQQVNTACTALPKDDSVSAFCDSFLRVAGRGMENQDDHLS